MPIIGPHRFTSGQPNTDDLHVIYRGSGGSLAHPKVPRQLRGGAMV